MRCALSRPCTRLLCVCQKSAKKVLMSIPQWSAARSADTHRVVRGRRWVPKSVSELVADLLDGRGRLRLDSGEGARAISLQEGHSGLEKGSKKGSH